LKGYLVELWQLTIFCSGEVSYEILGDEDRFKAELIAWREYEQRDNEKAQSAQESFIEEYINIDGFDVRIIEGFSCDIHQFPVVVGYRLNEVQGMVIMRVK